MQLLDNWHLFSTGSQTTWEYNDYTGQLTAKRDAANQATIYGYDAATGRLTTRTWARGVVATYGYDAAGRMSSLTYSDGTPGLTRSYDRAGRVASMTDAAGAHAYTYSPTSGSLSEEAITGDTVTAPWSGLTTTYTRDDDGRPASRAVSFRGTDLPGVSYGYDDAGRLSTITTPGANDAPTTITYARADNSQLITGWSYSTGETTQLTASRTFDDVGQLEDIQWTVGQATVSGHDYTLDAAGRRTAVTTAEGTTWEWGYNGRSEVVSAVSKDSTGTLRPGLDYSYQFDAIGNRTGSSVARASGSGAAHSTVYTPNALNQYTARSNPGVATLRGRAAAEAEVTVNGPPPLIRQNGAGWVWEKADVDNTNGPVWQQASVRAERPSLNPGAPNAQPMHTTEEGAVYVPPAAEVLTYDADGNLIQDGRWDYFWDGENRLSAMETTPAAILAGVPKTRLEFGYDSQSRRTMKRVFRANEEGILILQTTIIFLYDGWNLIAEFEMNLHNSSFNLHTSYEWGLDLSGSMTEAGGVGGLLVERIHQPSSTTTHAPTYDGNGNVMALINLATGQTEARYEYNAFGQTLTAEGGPVAGENRFRFSTKYEDAETTLLYYGYRYLSVEKGRWLNRDPIGAAGGINLYGMVENHAVCSIDILGLLDITVEKAGRADFPVRYEEFKGPRAVLLGGVCSQDATAVVAVPERPNEAGCYVISAGISQIPLEIVINSSPSRSTLLGSTEEILEHEYMHGDSFGKRLDHVASLFIAEEDTFKTRDEAIAAKNKLEKEMRKAIADEQQKENAHMPDDGYDTPAEGRPYKPTSQPKTPHPNP